MGGIGIVDNPRSIRSQASPGLGDRLRRLLGDDGLLVECGTPEALARGVEALRAAGVDTIGINGGDGTTSRVLTAFAEAGGGAPLPRLLPLRAGTLNTLAANHGWRGTPERILAEVLERRRAGLAAPAVARDLLRVEADGGRPAYGFLLGTGMLVALQDAIQEAGVPTPFRSAWVLSRVMLSALVGGSFAAGFTRRDPLRVAADGDEWPDAAFLALMAGTVPQVGLGFRALARCDEQPGFFHLVGVHGTLPLVARLLPGVRRGEPWRRRAAFDAVARQVTVEGEGLRYALDGDVHGPVRSLKVASGPGLEVLVPPGRGFDRARGGG